MAVGLEVTHALDRSRPLTGRLVVRGELDLSTADALRRRFTQVLDEGADMVFVDVTAVTFIDGAGLRSLNWAWQEFDQRGGRLVVDRTSRTVDRMLELTGLVERFRDGHSNGNGKGVRRDAASS